MNFNAASGATGPNRTAGFTFDPSVVTAVDQPDPKYVAVRKFAETKDEFELADVIIELRNQKLKSSHTDAVNILKQLEDEGIIVKSGDTYKLKRPDYDPENFDKALDYIKKNRNNISVIRLQRALELGYDEADDILEEMERRKYVSNAAPNGERKILVEPDAPPQPGPSINQDTSDDEAEDHPYSAIKIEHFNALSDYLATKFPDQPTLKDKFKPVAISLKSMPDGIHIESDKFTEKLILAEKKIEAEIQKDKTLSVEAVYLMTGIAVAKGMKSVRVNGTDEEKLLLALAAMKSGLKVSNLDEVREFASRSQDVFKAIEKTWDDHVRKMHPEQQQQRPGPTSPPPPGPAP